jgi:hypothetical protein
VHACHKTQRERKGKKARKEREEKAVEKYMTNIKFGVHVPFGVQTSKELQTQPQPSKLTHTTRHYQKANKPLTQPVLKQTNEI